MGKRLLRFHQHFGLTRILAGRRVIATSASNLSIEVLALPYS
jgi:hypothetical protein